ncbi:hypothetical protein GQ42DRAFT_75449 [Ramicandelaber brevisporus]|nr:hypothetical protein GQ42DRAFT_75449 [Ramicandelaber brevisporus]
MHSVLLRLAAAALAISLPMAAATNITELNTTLPNDGQPYTIDSGFAYLTGGMLTFRVGGLGILNDTVPSPSANSNTSGTPTNPDPPTQAYMSNVSLVLMARNDFVDLKLRTLESKSPCPVNDHIKNPILSTTLWDIGAHNETGGSTNSGDTASIISQLQKQLNQTGSPMIKHYTRSADTYVLFLLNCANTTIQMSYTALEINYYSDGTSTHLGAGYMLMPSIYLALTAAVWPFFIAVWCLLLWLGRRQRTTRALLVVLGGVIITRFLWCLAMMLYIDSYSKYGVSSRAQEMLKGIILAVCGLMLNMFAMLISKGWGIVRATIIAPERRMIGGIALFAGLTELFYAITGGASVMSLVTIELVAILYMLANYKSVFNRLNVYIARLSHSISAAAMSDAVHLNGAAVNRVNSDSGLLDGYDGDNTIASPRSTGLTLTSLVRRATSNPTAINAAATAAVSQPGSSSQNGSGARLAQTRLLLDVYTAKWRLLKHSFSVLVVYAAVRLFLSLLAFYFLPDRLAYVDSLIFNSMDAVQMAILLYLFSTWGRQPTQAVKLPALPSIRVDPLVPISIPRMAVESFVATEEAPAQQTTAAAGAVPSFTTERATTLDDRLAMASGRRRDRSLLNRIGRAINRNRNTGGGDTPNSLAETELRELRERRQQQQQQPQQQS